MQFFHKTTFWKAISKTSWGIYLGIVLVFYPIFVYFYSVYIYTTNIPFSDDYPTILNDTISIIQSENIKGKLVLLFSKSLEEILLLSKVIPLATYYVFGEIDLRLNRVIGNIAFLGLLFFIYKALPNKREKLFLLLPASLILFQLKQNWFYITVASTSVICLWFSGLVFYFLGKKTTKHFFYSGLVAVFSVLSFGSGLLTFPVGWLVLIIQKRFKLAWVWFFTTIIIIGPFIYFNKLTSSLSSSFAIIPSLNDLIRVGLFFISFLGSVFSFENQSIMFFCGALIIAYFIFLIYRKYYKVNLSVFSFMVYLILLAATAAFYRSGLGENAFMADRYKIYSLVMVLMVYISIIDLFYLKINEKWIFIISTVILSASFYTVSYVEGKQKLEFSKNILSWRMNQWLDQNYNLMAHPFQNQANAIMTRALTGGYYKLPYKLINIPEKKYSALVNSNKECSQLSEVQLESNFNVIAVGSESSPFLVRIEGMIYDQKPTRPTKSEPVYIVLSSQEGEYIFIANAQPHSEKSIHFQKKRTNKSLLALIPFNKLNDNIYQIGLCYQNQARLTNHFIIKQNNQFKHVIK
jgi:hypothetical protein